MSSSRSTAIMKYGACGSQGSVRRRYGRATWFPTRLGRTALQVQSKTETMPEPHEIPISCSSCRGPPVNSYWIELRQKRSSNVLETQTHISRTRLPGMEARARMSQSRPDPKATCRVTHNALATACRNLMPEGDLPSFTSSVEDVFVSLSAVVTRARSAASEFFNLDDKTPVCRVNGLGEQNELWGLATVPQSISESHFAWI